MKKRMFLMLVVMAVFVSAIGAVKYNQVKKSIAQHTSFQPPPESSLLPISTPPPLSLQSFEP